MTDPIRIVEVKEFACPFCNTHASVQTKDVIVDGDREGGFRVDYWTCKTCGSENDIFDEIDFSRMKNMTTGQFSQLSESDAVELFDFARHLVQKQEFEKAATIMQLILKHDPDDEQCSHLFAKVQKVLRLRELINVPVDFVSVSEALEDHFGMNTYHLNIKTGKVDVVSEWNETPSRRNDSLGDRIPLLPMSSRKVFEKMKEFLGAVDDEQLRQELSSALSGPHPFRRFKDALAAYSGETEYREMWFDIYNSFMWNEAVDYIIDTLARKESKEVVIDGKTYPVAAETRDVKVSTARIRNGAVLITVSSQLSEADKQEVVERLKKRIQQPRKTCLRFIEPVRKFSDGEIIDIGSKKYSIRIDFDNKHTSSGRLVGNTIHLRIADGLPDEGKERHVYELVRKILSRNRQAALRRKLKELNRHHFNAHFKDVRWKRQMAQWGSCSENKYINISYRLLFAPEDVLEYVCIHELAHLLEFNHSKRFWKLVRNAMTDYEEKEQWLKENGGEIY